MPGRRTRRRSFHKPSPADSLTSTTTTRTTAFSSAPASVADRCSFGSDHDSLFPHLLVHSLAAPKNPSSTAQQYREDELVEEEEDAETFTEALKECQNRRFRSDTDAAFSPRFFLGSLTTMNKTSKKTVTNKTGSFPSPGTPTYRQPNYQKGWSSERVPLQANTVQKYGGGAPVHLPFNNGRTLPSKWEDAEKWIFSPNNGRPAVPPPHHRRPKSKSGPLGPPAYMSATASPLGPCFDSGRVGGFNGGSPFLAGVFVMDRGSCDSGSSGRGGGGGCGVGGRSSSANAEPYIVRSASVHGWSDTMMETSSSLPSSSQDEKMDSTNETGIIVSPAILRKDVATQMSPEGSTQSSPKARRSFSPSPPSTHPIEELGGHLSKLEVRDVQVDDQVTVTRWSKKHSTRGSDRHSTSIIEWKKRTVEANGSSSRWEVAETAKCISKSRREEAKITAWENLQKAKAEAAIRKLEMKLEKKRSSSMDKILKKLRSAHRKAQDMRTEVTANQGQQVARTTTKRVSYFRKTRQSGSFSGCFTCHAF